MQTRLKPFELFLPWLLLLLLTTCKDTTEPPLNAAPAVSITLPADGSSFAQGGAISFEGSANDPEDGELSGGSLVWSSSIGGELGTGVSISRSALLVGEHTITLTATDSQGASASTSVSITVTALPDLTVSARVAGSYVSGQTGVAIPVTVSRSGGDLTLGTYVTARLYWSTDGSWDETDTRLWKSDGNTPDYPNAVLNSTGSQTVTASVDIPAVSAGSYYVLAVVDSTDFHPESNEDNNVAAYEVSVTGCQVSGAVFLWPLCGDDRSRVTQDYAEFNGLGTNFRYHAGFDIGAPLGTFVLSAARGKVRRVNAPASSDNTGNHGLGNVVILDHSIGTDPAGPFSLYAHLETITVLDGAIVDQAGALGTVGISGLGECSPPCGPHLHFEIKD